VNVTVTPGHRAYLEQELDVPVVSPLGLTVAAIIDDIWGLANIRRFSTIRMTKWNHESLVEFALDATLATFDNDHLTRMVVRGHDACIRLAISPLNSRQLRLSFSRRDRDGAKHDRHPTLEAAIVTARTTGYYGVGASSLEPSS
jgi:hypothetical protein